MYKKIPNMPVLSKLGSIIKFKATKLYHPLVNKIIDALVIMRKYIKDLNKIDLSFKLLSFSNDFPFLKEIL